MTHHTIWASARLLYGDRSSALTVRLRFSRLQFHRETPSCPYVGPSAGWGSCSTLHLPERQRGLVHLCQSIWNLSPHHPVPLRVNMKACCERPVVNRMKNVDSVWSEPGATTLLSVDHKWFKHSSQNVSRKSYFMKICFKKFRHGDDCLQIVSHTLSPSVVQHFKPWRLRFAPRRPELMMMSWW